MKKVNIAGIVDEPGSTVKNKTSGWRTKKPIRDVKKCIKCMKCWLYCPDIAIDEKIITNYDYCKGCGICAEVCPVKCIKMEDEEK